MEKMENQRKYGEIFTDKLLFNNLEHNDWNTSERTTSSLNTFLRIPNSLRQSIVKLPWIAEKIALK